MRRFSLPFGARRRTGKADDPAARPDDEEHVSGSANGNTADMTQPHATDTAPAQVRSYGWSAEEYVREQGSQRAPRPERDGQRPAGSPRSGRPESPHDRHAQHDGHPQRPPRAQRPDHPERPKGGESPVLRADERPGTAPGRAESERRARMVRGRRRMLWMLVVLTVVAIGLAYLQLAAWWIGVPPAVLLTGYVLLLREAARADVEARDRRAAELAMAAAAVRRVEDGERGAQRGAEPVSAPAGQTPAGYAPVWPAHEPAAQAEIIDISEHVGDQLYDQYADAKLRAVGD